MINIVPYEAVGPVRFGMNLQEIREALGEPELITKDRRGNDVLRYEGMSVTVASAGAVEVGLLPELRVDIENIDVFNTPSAFNRLCIMDGSPQECLGFIVFLKLGITLTGFHDRNESQKAVTAFVAGRWDAMRPQMKPFSHKEYRE